MRNPSPMEGAALYIATAYLIGRDVFCMSFVYRLVPMILVGTALTTYCIVRAGWCVFQQVRE